MRGLKIPLLNDVDKTPAAKMHVGSGGQPNEWVVVAG